MNIADKAWLAGIIDGEGSIYIGRTRRSTGVYFQPGCVVTMTHATTMRKVARLLHRPLYTHTPKYPGAKRYWSVRLWNQEAARKLTPLLPYLVTKQRQARSLMRIARLQKRSKRGYVAGARAQQREYELSKRLNA